MKHYFLKSHSKVKRYFFPFKNSKSPKVKTNQSINNYTTTVIRCLFKIYVITYFKFKDSIFKHYVINMIKLKLPLTTSTKYNHLFSQNAYLRTYKFTHSTMHLQFKHCHIWNSLYFSYMNKITSINKKATKIILSKTSSHCYTYI